ncbi:aspartate--tRNA ligase [Anaerobranca gottschalkii]|uniref:Aspartate--tRNA ligase n=1 Tax=Anaerobranca gottschalkii DSM 13577 TaxID=1120990 RepID=A0A1I0ASR3_9FIRM|nr:aspartate--tRNA ligase [Anaerobranca gottschalkii]SES97222.1 aspartyl-tRNA synthetase [Anaerobranca gottschalkii DSM 13577]
MAERTHYCGHITETLVGQTVTVKGWVAKRRDLGGLIFFDLRDREGIVQCIINNDNQKAFQIGDEIRGEYVVEVTGEVVRRSNPNPDIKTGNVEIVVEEITVLNTSLTPPFYITDEHEADANLRLKYRYLDLRRPKMLKNLMIRSKTTKVVRDYLDSHGFVDVETPILFKSTPEGARDYIVPSRVNPGTFYALPQSPQLLKQLLMVSGLDRYYQIARCFRDEDLRADRQPEFTQIDIEVSFMERDTFFSIIEGLVKEVFSKIKGIEIQTPFKHMDYSEAMNKYGSDKPDTRFGMEIHDLSDILQNSQFKVFTQTLQSGGTVRAIKAEGEFSRKEIDGFTEFVKKYGAKGLAWISLKGGEIKSPIAKFLSEGELKGILDTFNNQDGTILIVADNVKTALQSLGALRLHIAKKLDIIDKNKLNFLWIVNFPLLEYDEEEKRYIAAHHPFTSPILEDLPLLDTNPEKVRANAYDLVLNGVELAGGSVRIHQGDVQQKVFKAIGLTEEMAKEKFGFLLEGLSYGAPPHCGIAFGLDRLVMEMVDTENIRDVIAFPKTTSASDLMTDAPSPVDPKQLEELKISLKLD